MSIVVVPPLNTVEHKAVARLVAHNGEVIAARMLGIARNTLSRLLRGEAVRRGTTALARLRLAALAVEQTTSDAA